MIEGLTLIDPRVLLWTGPIAGVLFAAATVIAVARIIRGPSILDRMLGTDVLLATLLCGIGAVAAIDGRTDLLPVMIVIAGMGFIGSVGVSRYVARHGGPEDSGSGELHTAGSLIAAVRGSDDPAAADASAHSSPDAVATGHASLPSEHTHTGGSGLDESTGLDPASVTREEDHQDRTGKQREEDAS